VAEFSLARRFLRDLAECEGIGSKRDLKVLERALAAIATDPALPGRVPTFYDPTSPSYLFRAGAVLVHYRVTERGRVEFLNLFFRRI
jgi:hypothetical protein